MMVRYALLLAMLMTFVPVHGVSAPFVPTINTPFSAAEVEEGLKEARENRDSVECGGWIENSQGSGDSGSVDGDLFFPTMSDDVPGEPNNSESERDALRHGSGAPGTFSYPASAFGFLSACDITQSSMTDLDLAKLALDVIYDDVGDDPNADPNVRTSGGEGNIMINPYGWCIGDKRTPRWCQKLFETLTRMNDVVSGLVSVNPDCADPPQKNYCFSPSFTKACTGEECRTLPDDTNDCRALRTPSFESKVSECHRDLLPDNSLSDPVIDVPGYENGTTASFYRHYAGAFADWSELSTPESSSLRVTSPEPDDEWELRAECYGYYREHQPQECVMGSEDEQCEIIIKTDSEDSPKTPQWKDHDDFKQKGEVKPDSEIVKEEPSPRASRSHPDPWFEDNATNLSLIDSETLRTIDPDAVDPFNLTTLANTFLLDRVTITQERKPLSSRTDSMSDDGKRRFQEFWEEEQRALLKRMHEPKIHLILPSRFFVQLSEHDPLFRLADHRETIGTDSVQLTVGADTPLIEGVIESLKQSTVFPLREVRIPIVMPLISRIEIDHLIADWREWERMSTVRANDTGLPAHTEHVDAIVNKLTEYRNYLTTIQKLRTVREKLLEKVLEPEAQIRLFFANWYADQQKNILALEVENTKRAELRSLWREVQSILLRTDEESLPWCSNQRYSLALPSLLDLPNRWWGNKEPGEERDDDFSPEESIQDIPYTIPPDREYDFSRMGFSTGSITLPTLWPILTSVNLPRPPLVGSATIAPEDMFSLPSLPSPEELMNTVNIPAVSLPPLPTIPPFPPHDLTTEIEILTEWKTKMEERKENYERFPKSILTPPDRDQITAKPEKIIHPEYELRARIERLFSRWGSQLKSDYAGRKARFVAGETIPAEKQCVDGVICMVKRSVVRASRAWQWYAPDVTVSFTSWVNTAQNSLPSNDENPLTTPRSLLDRMMLFFSPPVRYEDSLLQ